MNMSPRSVVEKQVRKVRRRLIWQSGVRNLLVAWTVALGLAALWLAGQALFAPSVTETWLRWTIPAALVGVGTLVALAMALATAPPLVTASLLLDERCGLRERVTTFLTLPDELLQKPAGQALAQ